MHKLTVLVLAFSVAGVSATFATDAHASARNEWSLDVITSIPPATLEYGMHSDGEIMIPETIVPRSSGYICMITPTRFDAATQIEQRILMCVPKKDDPDHVGLLVKTSCAADGTEMHKAALEIGGSAIVLHCVKK